MLIPAVLTFKNVFGILSFEREKMKTISAHIWNPKKTIFKSDKNDHVECQTVSCDFQGECPVAARGKCLAIPVLFPGYCPYGEYRVERGPTMRSQAFHTWITEREEKYKGTGTLYSGWSKLTFLGDYVYLPYFHMSMNHDIPFLFHSELITTDHPFIKKEDWVIETVLKIIDFHPLTYFGEEITNYQEKIVPKFISHLREMDKEMFGKLVAVRKQCDVVPNYVGRKALLYTLNFPIEWVNESEKYNYPVAWKWDGKELITDSQNIYSSTWGGSIKMQSVKFTGIPDPKTFIIVRDNAWVNDKTEFAD